MEERERHLPQSLGKNGSSFRNVVLYSYLEFRTMDKVYTPSGSEYIPTIHKYDKIDQKETQDGRNVYHERGR
jgi:hypothetical protein